MVTSRAASSAEQPTPPPHRRPAEAENSRGTSRREFRTLRSACRFLGTPHRRLQSPQDEFRMRADHEGAVDDPEHKRPMKRQVLLLMVLAIMGHGAARAAVVSHDWKTPGDSLLTYDT